MTDTFIKAMAESQFCVLQAKKHILDFEKEFRVFIDKKQYETVTEHDSKWVYLTKIKFTEPFIIYEFATRVTYIINDLRAALNYALGALAVTSGTIDPDAFTKFPFANNASSFERKLKKGFKKFPPEIITPLRRFEPYEGGDNLLWALDRIAVTNRYNMLAPVVLGVGKLRGSVWSTEQVSFVPSPNWNSSKNEIVVFSVTTTGRTPLTQSDLKVSPHIEFDPSVPVVGGKPVVAKLFALVDKVEDILEALGDAARTLGLIT